MTKVQVDYSHLSTVIEPSDMVVFEKFEAVILECSISTFLSMSSPCWKPDTSVEAPSYYQLMIGDAPSQKVLSITIPSLRNTSVDEMRNLLVERALFGGK